MTIRPLEFELTGRGVTVVSGTNDRTQLAEFIERLRELLPLLPDAQGIEARQGGDAEGGSVHESPVAEGDAPQREPSTMIPIQGERK